MIFLKFFLSLFVLIVPFIIGCTNNISFSYDAYFISPNERVTLEQEVKKGDTKAAEKLAYHYLYAEHDNEKAIEYMRILAISGNARMQHNMAAALSDDVYSMVKMAEFYEEGKCEEKYLIQSYSWLRLAESSTSNKSSLGKSIRNKEKRLINQL